MQLIEAEDALRKAATGCEGVIEAGLKLGAEPVDVSKPPRHRMKQVAQSRAAQQLATSSKPAQRKEAPAKRTAAAERNEVAQPAKRKARRATQRRGFFD